MFRLKSLEVPDFPKPDKNVSDEIKKVCTPETCKHLYNWLGKVMIFDKQLEITKEKNKNG